jgi:Zn finger protein HypA/HybF involved in hydrogenase expression
MKKPSVKIKCLKCDKLFKPLAKFNRICYRCKIKKDFEAGKELEAQGTR